MLSNTAEYALRAVLYLAANSEDTPIRAPDVATALHIPPNYLGKILHGLARADVLKSARGKRGGFELAAAPEDIPLISVVSVFDRVAETRSCLLGRQECSDHHACAAHQRWKTVSEQIATFFRETTVADLLIAPNTLGRRS